MKSEHLMLAKKVASLFANLPQVKAVALGGSRGSGSIENDAASDIDIYVYTQGDVSLEERQAIVKQTGGASLANLMLNYWGPGDEWYNLPTGIEVDIVYFEAAWMENQIDRVITQAQPAMGYSTCFWYTLRNSISLSDPHGWLAALQNRCLIDYPESLRQAIIGFNYPVLRGIIPAYAHQIEKAARRGDLISVNHRLAALLASYFDVLFAFNRVLHPGEKRMLAYAKAGCSHLPKSFESDLQEVLRSSCADLTGLPNHVNRLLDHLDQLLKEDNVI